MLYRQLRVGSVRKFALGAAGFSAACSRVVPRHLWHAFRSRFRA